MEIIIIHRHAERSEADPGKRHEEIGDDAARHGFSRLALQPHCETLQVIISESSHCQGANHSHYVGMTYTFEDELRHQHLSHPDRH